MLRLSSSVALLAALLFSASASAQSLQVAPAEGLTLAPMAPAPGQFVVPAPGDGTSSFTPGCTLTTIANAVGGSGYPHGNTAATGGAAQELGQSFTSNCTGTLYALSVALAPQTAATANTVVSGTYYLYSGAGTAGTLLSATSFSGTLPAAGFFANFAFYVDAVPITSGAVYTVFADMNPGSNASIVGSTSTGGAYAGGTAFFSTSGGPTPASAIAGLDLRFAAYVSPTTAAASPTVYNGAGWRLLSTPVYGTTVRDLGAINLVQGVPSGTPAALYAAEYPTFGANILTDYSGSGTAAGYTPPTTTSQIVYPSEGFFWYFYDQAFGPYSDGTSQSRELTGFALSASGTDIAANTVYTWLPTADNWYMVGNPFPSAFNLSGLTTNTGTFQTTAVTYDPAISNYRFLTLASDAVATWQGFMVQLSGATGNPVFTYATAARTTATPPFYGRGGDAAAVASVPFELHGTTTSGAAVHDVTATVRFLADALVGWDAQDLGKLAPPPAAASALIAPMGERDGAPARLAINALPLDLTAPLSVPVAFMATEAGTFTISWPGTTLPTGWSALLTDAATGATVDLAATADYTFAATAGDWAERFALVITPAGVTANEPVATSAFRLGNVAPNPTAGAASLALRVGTAQDVRATVYDALGRQVAVAFDGPATPAADVVIALDARPSRPRRLRGARGGPDVLGGPPRDGGPLGLGLRTSVLGLWKDRGPGDMLSPGPLFCRGLRGGVAGPNVRAPCLHVYPLPVPLLPLTHPAARSHSVSHFMRRTGA